MKNANSNNFKVRVGLSNIGGGGNGLFAKEKVMKGSLVCTYGGRLVDPQEANFENPMYIVDFENGRGFKLIGDAEDGDVGHFANAIHPQSKELKQNARFSLSHNHKQTLPGYRGRFHIYAKNDIEAGEEIIVNYGNGYWKKVDEWFSTPRPIKSPTVIARDVRAQKRHQH